jgi:hypothetical protein
MAYRSISDDDLCATCAHCSYRPGNLSGCSKDFPAVFADGGPRDGYAVSCDDYVPKGWDVVETASDIHLSDTAGEDGECHSDR